jgi:hypothetical protein
MTAFDWFADQLPIGKQPPQEAEDRLREVGEIEAADALQAAIKAAPTSYGIASGRVSTRPSEAIPSSWDSM